MRKRGSAVRRSTNTADDDLYGSVRTAPQLALNRGRPPYCYYSMPSRPQF